jgi:hypothetical protein
MRIFLSGIISGSHAGKEVHDQGYRQELRDILQRAEPDAEIICPWDMHPGAVDYGPELAKETLLAEVETAAAADLVVAYIPQASMGTAIEMWEASKRGVPVLAISPLHTNWVLILLAQRTFHDIAAFADFALAGGLAAYRPPAE